MKSTDILQRQSDRALFRVVNLAHWSDVEGISDKSVGEVDLVKWVGGDQYVSCDKGDMYRNIGTVKPAV